MKKQLVWRFLIALVIFQLATQLSLWSLVTTGSSLFYLVVPFALVLMYWWGPIVLPAIFINASLSAGLWGLENPLLYPLFAIPETLFVFLSWLFYIKLAKGKYWFPNAKALIYFLVLGIALPLIIYSFLLREIFLLTSQMEKGDFWKLLYTTTLADFVVIFNISIPILFFFTSKMEAKGFISLSENIATHPKLVWSKYSIAKPMIEISILILIIPILSRFLDLSNYWFVYGLLSLYAAVRFGFGVTVILNAYIFILTYIIPAFENAQLLHDLILVEEMAKTQIGSILLYTFALIISRVISDEISNKRFIKEQHTELSQTNEELDRFVYSVSHDLSAPLKSIKGLVNISRIEEMNQRMKEYMDHIEMSTKKLESFIAEILHYSASEKEPIAFESFSIKELCAEVLDGLQFFENFKQTEIDIKELEDISLICDKTKLKIILTNLLSNAIKYQDSGKEGKVRITTKRTTDHLVIKIEDNGEGIHPEAKSRIFEMFYRGTESSNGSGLGLYITNEIINRLKGTISVRSKLGVGTTFIVTVPTGNEVDLLEVDSMA